VDPPGRETADEGKLRGRRELLQLERSRRNQRLALWPPRPSGGPSCTARSLVGRPRQPAVGSGLTVAQVLRSGDGPRLEHPVRGVVAQVAHQLVPAGAQGSRGPAGGDALPEVRAARPGCLPEEAPHR